MLWYGQTGSALGDAALPVAIAVAVAALHGSAAMIGWTIAASRGTQAACSLIGGSWADRHDRRQSMLAADLIRAVAQAGVGAALLAGRASVWLLPASGVLCGAAAAFFRACAIGLTPSLVPERMLSTANGLMALSRRAAVAVGPVAAAGVIVVGGPGGAYLLDGASFAISAFSIARIAASWRPRPGNPREENAREGNPRGGSSRGGSLPPGFWRSIVVGARPILAARWVRGSLAVFAAANVALGALYVAGPIVCWHRFGGAGAWAIILTGLGVGGIVGGFASLEAQPRKPVRAIWLLSLPCELQLLVLAYARSPYLVAVAAAVAMACMMTANTLWLTVLQQRMARDLLGRATSYDWLVSLGGMCVGLIATAPLSNVLHPDRALVLITASAVLVTVALISSERIIVPQAEAGGRPGACL